jgi:hypothetical protein
MRMYNPDIPDSECDVIESAFEGVWKEKGWMRLEEEVVVARAFVPGPLGSVPAEPDPWSVEAMSEISMTDLRNVARERDLKVGGSKLVLIARIREDVGFEVVDD